MTTHMNPYTAGYQAAYDEIYRILNDEAHQKECGGCKPCGLIKNVVEVLMESLASRMSQEEFFGLALILARTGHTMIDGQGYVGLDAWAMMNGAVNEDGTYDWQEPGE